MRHAVILLAAALALSGCAVVRDVPSPSGLVPYWVSGRIGPEADADRMQAASVQPGDPAERPPVGFDQYLRRAAMNDLYEIQAGQVVADRSENWHVRRYADRMLRQHLRLSQRRDRRAELVGFTPAGLPQTLDPAHAAMITRLQIAPDVDREYIAQQRRAKNRAFTLHTGYMRNGDTDRLRREAGWDRRYVLRHLRQLSRLEPRVIRP